MSLVENLVQQLTSSNGLGAISKPQGFDMNDDTFAKLLEKTMAAEVPDKLNQFGQLGVPAGFEIEPMEGTSMQIAETQPVKLKETEPFEIKDLNLGDYLSNYLSDKNNYNSPVMNMAIKQASSAYNSFGKELISDIKELAADLVKNM